MTGRPGSSGVGLTLPDPPLADAGAVIILRPWAATPDDVAALVAAWSDPVLAAANRVPDEVSAASARRWIAGDARRRAAGRGLDLVVGPLDGGSDVLGEVGLRNIDRDRRRAEISWWVAAEARGRGLATAATRLLAAWALSAEGGDLDQVWARIVPDHDASARVAAAAGFTELGPAGATHVWSRTRGSAGQR
jgi:RimJ/RimL family protein N-acetyltransferase